VNVIEPAAWLYEAAVVILGNDVGFIEFPRDLETIVWRIRPIAFVPLENLSLCAVEQYLERMDAVAVRPLCADRRLRGCIVADHGEAFVFYDPTEPSDERRFTIAHELAHYALDYALPRERAVQALGESILPILNGDQVPTHAQRIDAALSATPIGSYIWLMDRDDKGRIAQARIIEVESHADALALHLLAPANEVVRRLSRSSYGEMERERFHDDASGLLQSEFGLPLRTARAYVSQLWPHVVRADTRSWLGMK
jgi:Zn-dependent peptidase ImmA (M78 family)